MPRGWLTLLIVLFWLGATAWFVVREVAPRFETGDPPPFTFELIDEIGGRIAHWVVLIKVGDQEQPIGTGHSEVRHAPDRTFELKTRANFKDPALLIRQFTHVTRVSEEGALRGFVTSIGIGLGASGDIMLEAEGAVEDEHLTGCWRLGGKEVALPRVKVPRNVYNPVDLLPRVRGLYAGQRWSQPLFNPLDAKPSAGRMDMPLLVADVSRGVLRWHDEDVACLKIEQSKPGEPPLGVTWIRERDGLVLQREITEGVHLIFRRR